MYFAHTLLKQPDHSNPSSLTDHPSLPCGKKLYPSNSIPFYSSEGIDVKILSGYWILSDICLKKLVNSKGASICTLLMKSKQGKSGSVFEHLDEIKIKSKLRQAGMIDSLKSK